MALKPCRECKKEVSTEATMCPHCGTPKPTVQKASAKDTLIGLVVFVAIVAGSVTMCSDSDEEKAAAAKKAAAAEEACRDDLKCIGDKLSISAAGPCARAVEKLAKNSMRWTDQTLEPKFSHFRWGKSDQSVVRLVGDRAEFQNGFGAHINVVYECDVDAKSRNVLDARVKEGRL